MNKLLYLIIIYIFVCELYILNLKSKKNGINLLL